MRRDEKPTDGGGGVLGEVLSRNVATIVSYLCMDWNSVVRNWLPNLLFEIARVLRLQSMRWWQTIALCLWIVMRYRFPLQNTIERVLWYKDISWTIICSFAAFSLANYNQKRDGENINNYRKSIIRIGLYNWYILNIRTWFCIQNCTTVYLTSCQTTIRILSLPMTSTLIDLPVYQWTNFWFVNHCGLLKMPQKKT